MKNTRHLVVAYDIQDDSLRDDLARTLFFYGLIRIQYSVFRGEVSNQDKDKILFEIKNMELQERDKVIILDICDDCLKREIVIGNVTNSPKHLVL